MIAMITMINSVITGIKRMITVIKVNYCNQFKITVITAKAGQAPLQITAYGLHLRNQE